MKVFKSLEFDSFFEKAVQIMFQADVSQLRIRIKALQETVEMLKARNVQLLAEKDEICTRMRISKIQNQQTFIGKCLKKCRVQ